jgi:8-oxo-dGTP diphosphatase
MDDLFDSLISAGLLSTGLSSTGLPSAGLPSAAVDPAPTAPQRTTAAAAPVLRTKRILLRPLQAEDAPAFHRLINDWDICRKLPDAPFPYPVQLATEWIAAAAADRAAGKAQQFALVEEASGVLIGCAGLRLSRDGKSADLGYWLGRKFWRQGFGLEVATRLTSWGLAEMQINRVTATVADDNEASLAVLKRAGFFETGKGTKAFLCRAEAKLPVRHLAATRETPKSETISAAAAPLPSVLLVAACALIDPEGRVLLARRPEGKKMAGLWEFPGGKLDAGETPEAALIRELKEELGIVVEAKNLAPFVFASQAYDGFHLLMPVFLCRRWQGKPQPREGQALAWVAPDRLVEYPMPAADRPLIPMLRDFL